MPKVSRDTSLDTLLDLHGQILVVDEKGQYWVKFVVMEGAGNIRSTAWPELFANPA
jgi:hypothetical protein